jgi:hypothetical protein
MKETPIKKIRFSTYRQGTFHTINALNAFQCPLHSARATCARHFHCEFVLILEKINIKLELKIFVILHFP